MSPLGLISSVTFGVNMFQASTIVNSMIDWSDFCSVTSWLGRTGIKLCSDSFFPFDIKFLFSSELWEELFMHIRLSFRGPHINKDERHLWRKTESLISRLIRWVLLVTIHENVTRVTTNPDGTLWNAFIDEIDRYCQTSDNCHAFSR